MAVKKNDGIGYYLDGKTTRWLAVDMPIPVFIAPCNWHSDEYDPDDLYALVLNTMKHWEYVSNGVVTFKLVELPPAKGIKVLWRRTRRKAIGWCQWYYDAKRYLKMADVTIGMPDTAIHAAYQGIDYIYHVILHEFGHALGLDHTPYPEDVMHGRGGTVMALSQRENNYLYWNYRLPAGFEYEKIGSELGLGEPILLTQVVDQLRELERLDEYLQEPPETIPEPALPLSLLEAEEGEHDLRNQQDILDTMGRFYMETQPQKLYLFKPRQV